MDKYWSTDESKEERAHLRVYVGRVFAFISLLVLTVVATKAYAETLVHKDRDGTVIRLFDKPCTNAEILSRGHPQFHHLWHAASATFRRLSGAKTDHDGCWRKFTLEQIEAQGGDGPEKYRTVWDDGDWFDHDLSEFTQEGV